MKLPILVRVAFLPAALGLAAFAGPSGSAPIAPGDVYYRVRDYQDFKYYAFANDHVVWEDRTYEGTSVTAATAHDTVTTPGTSGTSASFEAAAGTFSADLGAYIAIDARTGIFYLMTNRMTVDVYLKRPAGTPYEIAVSRTGQAYASRLGGLPGSLQDVNGTSQATFADSIAYTAETGVVTVPVADTFTVSGLTSTALVVGADTYTLARTITFTTSSWTTQAVCILGCMQAAATFNANASGHVELTVALPGEPVDVPRAPDAATELSVRAAPNPARGKTSVVFRAPAGERVRLEVLDLQGRRVASLFDGAASGSEQRVEWRAGALPRGLYFVRADAGMRTRSERLALVD